MGRNKNQEPDILDDNIDPVDDIDFDMDEDELYLRETESLDDRDLWDGDDYLGDEFDDEEDDYPFDDEE